MADINQRILDDISHPKYKPVKAKRLAKNIGVKKKQMPQFREALDDLIESGTVREGKNGLIRLKSTPGLIAGIIKKIASGAAFFIPHELPPGIKPTEARKADIFIDARHLGNAHTGDEVLVRLVKDRNNRGRRNGRVEQIIERATSTFVGTYLEQHGQGFVQVDGKNFAEPIYVGDPGAKGAQPDDKVVIEMLRFPSHFGAGEAVLTKVLGAAGEPGIDLLSVIHEFGLPDEFPETVEEEARTQADQFDESNLDKRRDLTKDTIVTIDPVDARDFDDAISLTRSRDRHWHLGVHIADVSHFVQPDSALDIEAQKRGTSVYLPGRVIPMIPELISNGLASLQQGKVRYVKSAFIEFDPQGIPLHTEFARSAIKVTRRFAYEEVMPIVEKPEKFKTSVSAKVRALLARMHELAMILRSRRIEAGALQLDLSELKLDFDKRGRVIGAHETENDESHQIIEEFMLAANIAVATKLKDLGIPFMRRVHGNPELLKLQALAKFVSALGFKLQNCQSRQELQALIDKVRETPHEHAINYALLRSMKQAEYTGMELGHYALAEDHYCHFTSPIRRYPDLTIHRLMEELIMKKGKQPSYMSAMDLTKLGKHCSAVARRAETAERELIKVKLLTYISEHVGEELDAVITGVERFGIFCKGVEVPVEGLVPIHALSQDDYYDFDPNSFSIVGRRKGRKFQLGDRVRVVVVHVDIDRRELDFRIVSKSRSKPSSKTSKPTARPHKKKPAKKRKPGKRTSKAKNRRTKQKKSKKSDSSVKKKASTRPAKRKKRNAKKKKQKKRNR